MCICYGSIRFLSRQVDICQIHKEPQSSLSACTVFLIAAKLTLFAKCQFWERPLMRLSLPHDMKEQEN